MLSESDACAQLNNNGMIFKRSISLGHATIFHNVSDVHGSTNWINDWAAMRDILIEFEADANLSEIDKAKFANDNFRFIYDWMCYFKYRSDHFSELPSVSFNIGFTFDLSVSIQNPKDFSLLYMPRENRYKCGAIYKRFHSDCAAVIFEDGEGYITGRNTSEIYWIGGIMNHILSQVRPRQSTHPLSNQTPVTTGRKLIETWDIFKFEKESEDSELKSDRVQPERAAKRRALLLQDNGKRKKH